MADAPPPGLSPPKVPAGWKALWNAQYNEWFYANTITKASQWDHPTASAVSPFTTTATATEPEKQSTRTRLLRGFAYAGVPAADAEKITALYMQRQFASSPPPLPPRPRLESPGLERPSSDVSILSSNTSARCEILIVDDFNHFGSVLAQFYLEFIRTWAANHGGPWLFHRVDSAGLNIRTPWRSSAAGRLDNDQMIFKSPDEVLSNGALENITIVSPFLKTTDRPYESDRIIERMRTHRCQGLDRNTFSQYDYLLTFKRRTFETLNTLLEVHNWDVQDQTNTTAPPRIFLLKGLALENKTQSPSLTTPIYNAICDFAHRELGWEEPKTGIMHGDLRTSFMQIQLEEHMQKIVGEGETNLRRIERQTNCKLHVTKQSLTYGWVVAIVGPWGKLWEPESLVRRLRNGEKIEWREA